MEAHLRILQARRCVLRKPVSHNVVDVVGDGGDLEQPPLLRLQETQSVPAVCTADPFSVESHGFYIGYPSTALTGDHDKRRAADAGLAARSAPGNSVSKVKASAGRIEKGNAKKSKRFVANWTPEMDKVVKKALSKFGWGCWTRIAASGKLPKEYTAKMISNRAKSIGLTREMYGPLITGAAKPKT